MKRILAFSFTLLLSTSCGLAQGLNSGGGGSIQHKQNLHQYIVQEAYKIIQQEAPVAAVKLAQHIGGTGSGTGPWDLKTICAGAWREDEEDIVYGYGGWIYDDDPDFDISYGICLGDISNQVKQILKQDTDFRKGLISTSHFWDPDATDNYLRKTGIVVDGTDVLDCLDNQDLHITIKPETNAWLKAQRLLEPGDPLIVAVRDFWWTPSERFYNSLIVPNGYWDLPSSNDHTLELKIGYTSLAQLYNDGQCSLTIGMTPLVEGFVLTQEQRDHFVWEIFGRVCHLLMDMSVPAHTHKDIHAGNLDLTKQTFLGSIHFMYADADSYEQWVAHAGSGQDGDLSNIYWTADLVTQSISPNPALIDVSNRSDPLAYLMTQMRALTASFASDEYDGTGGQGDPVHTYDIPYLHDVQLNPPQNQVAVLANIRDVTVPYCIRAVATLLAWFADETHKLEDFQVRNVGTHTPYGFWEWDPLTSGFSTTETQSPKTYNTMYVGDVLKLRGHWDMTPENWKCYGWSSNYHGAAADLQRDLVINENQDNIDASYTESQVNTVPTIEMQFEAGTMTPASGLNVQFKNPWLVDPTNITSTTLNQNGGFKEFAIPFQPLHVAGLNDNGGIFLDAGRPDFLVPPYYALSTPNTLAGGTLQPKQTAPGQGDWCFLNWSATGASLVNDPLNGTTGYPDKYSYATKAVIFENADATATAAYKGHLISTEQSSGYESICATCPNSQRKLDWTAAQSGVQTGSDGLYQLCYESAGMIWYTQSTDKGQSWAPELQVAIGTHPSLVTTSGGGYVVYNMSGEMDAFKIDGGTTTTYIPMPSCPMSDPDASPVLARDEMEDVVFTVWERSDGKLEYSVNVDGANVDHGIIPQSGSNGVATKPSLVHANGSTSYSITWREDGRIVYCDASIWTYNQYYIVFVYPDQLQWPLADRFISNDWQPAAGAPSISLDNEGHPAVAWSASDPLHGTFINFRQYLAAGWGTMATMVDNVVNSVQYDFWAPSVSCFSDQPYSEGIRIAHNASNTQLPGNPGICVQQLMGGSFVTPAPFQSGNEKYHPNLVSMPLQEYSREVATSYPVQRFTTSTVDLLFSNEHLTKTASRDILESSRELSLLKDSSRASLRFGEVLVHTGQSDESLKWNTGFDTLVVGRTKTVGDYLRTESFTVPSNATLKYRFTKTRTGSTSFMQSVSLRLRIVDAATKQVLAEPSVIHPGAFNNGVEDVRHACSLNQFGGQDVFVQIVMDGVDSTAFLFANDIYYRPGTTLPRAGHIVDDAVANPETVELYQNYPNPFNPTSEIRFSLPTAMKVQLAVYDPLGRRVALLIDGMQDAGIHGVNFDAGALTSGTYIYTLTANGNTLSRSMSLVR
jgi:hypothetical protein